MSRKKTKTEQYYALFIDVMGFAKSVETLTMREQDLLEEGLMLGHLDPDYGERVLRVLTRYRHFHDELSSVSEHQDVAAVIAFSDSAFVICRTFDTARSCAAHAMRNCFADLIPLRIGIGLGTFARLAFETSHHPSGRFFGAAPFLGTAVIRAYRASTAESCPGFRILIHPSAYQPVFPMESGFFDLPSEEKSESCVQEVNFISSAWPTESREYRSDPTRGDLCAMRQGVDDPRVLRHYDATNTALNRLHQKEQDVRHYGPSTKRKPENNSDAE